MPTQTSDQPVSSPAAPEQDGQAEVEQRARLTRSQVLEAALAYVDENGLAALSMRKLGAALGVEGTALYNHVQGKDGLLDGLVELLWAEMREATDTEGTWQDVLRSAARAMRATAHRHPETAQLVCARSVMPLDALRLTADCVARMEQAGFERSAATQAMCTVSGHAYGYALMEQMAPTCGTPGDGSESAAQRIRRVAQTLPPDVPDDLFQVGLDLSVCGTDAHFEAGIDILIDGIASACDQRPS